MSPILVLSGLSLEDSSRSSSPATPIRSLKLVLPLRVLLDIPNLLILAQEYSFLASQNSTSCSRSSDSTVAFFSSWTTGKHLLYGQGQGLAQSFPLLALGPLLYVFFAVFIYSIYYSLESLSSEEDVPNYYFFKRMRACFLSIFIFMYYSCCLWNSASFSSSLSSPTASLALLTCLYSMSLGGLSVDFFDKGTTRALFTLSCILIILISPLSYTTQPKLQPPGVKVRDWLGWL